MSTHTHTERHRLVGGVSHNPLFCWQASLLSTPFHREKVYDPIAVNCHSTDPSSHVANRQKSEGLEVKPGIFKGETCHGASAKIWKNMGPTAPNIF